ncbi:immunoglobulin domain-containing family protein, partial [Streptosporangium sandarakinum]
MQLQESGPGLVHPSHTLSLTCTVSGDSISSTSYYWTWIRQPAGKGLEWIGHISPSGTTNYNPSLTTRVTLSLDMSQRQVSLTLTSVTAADTAVYFCAREALEPFVVNVEGATVYRYYGTDVWGQGTTVTVSSASTKGPSVTSGQAGQ